MKARSTFFRSEILERIRKNAQGSEIKNTILEDVKKWVNMSDDQLWKSVYGSELKRSHMVLSYGWCPSCGKTVSLYGWITDPFNKPWKICCPNCGEAFPKNDFEKFYNSGLDENYVFSSRLADRSFLYNEDAPEPKDGKHMFGVDDGTGYKEGNERWMFIGTYLLKVWEKHIFAGIVTLARAYVLTGKSVYARKCGILLDRVADLFPDFDFYEQGVMYEKEYSSRGYVVYWCDTAIQLRPMLIAYDAVFEALKEDEEFQSFVVEKSKKYNTPYRKKCFRDIQKNIEHGIFNDAISNKWKIEANYPWTEMVLATAKMVLSDWPEHPDDMSKGVYNILWWVAEDDLNRILEKATKVDGLSGEKGFQAYSTIALEGAVRLLSLYSLYDKDILKRAIQKYPGLLKGIRFFMNGWLLNSYYPGCGDCGSLSAPDRGIPISPGYTLFNNNFVSSSILFSYEGFLWQLYELTGDVEFVRYIYNAENYDMKKCFSADLTLNYTPKELQKKVIALMEEKGSKLEQQSVNCEAWKLAILHSGRGENRRCAYLDCDSGGVHGHNDGMNIGIFAKGINLLPDLGYPPAHRPGGWGSKFFYWYRSAAAHNTVIVDGKEHRDYCYVQRDVNGGQGLTSESGETVLWGIGQWVKAVASNDPLITDAQRFERMLAIVDVSDTDCYYLDIFRVKGGKEHVKLTHGSVCELKTTNLRLVPYTPEQDPYGMCFIRDRNPEENFHYSVDSEFKFVRNTSIDTNPPDDWKAEWVYLDKYEGYLGTTGGRPVSLIYRDLTDDAQVITFDSFYDSYHAVTTCYPERTKGMKRHPEEMLPGVAVVRKGDGSLTSVFIGVYEPCEGNSCICSIRRLPVSGKRACKNPEGAVAIEIQSKNGCTDLILVADQQEKGIMIQPGWDVETDAALCLLRKEDGGRCKVTLMKGSYFRRGNWKIQLESAEDIYESETMEVVK